MLYFILLGAAYLTCAASEIQLTLNVQDKVSYKEGTGAVLMCTVKGVTSGDPKFEWISSLNKVVTSTTKTDRLFLRNKPGSAWIHFQPVERIDAGTWECKLTVPGTNIAMSKKVQIETWKDLEFPNFKALQQPVIGTDALIECVVNSRPVPTIDWIIKGKYLYQLTGADQGRFHQEKKGLRIQKITEADNGKYECEAIIATKGARQVRAIEVEVTIPPEITSPLVSDKDAVLGKDVKVTCKASVGTPRPTYTWTKAEGSMSNSVITTDRITVNSEAGTLEITKLEKSDKGDYACKAENLGGESTKVYTLDVKEPATVLPLSDVSGKETETATIMCEATGNPIPSIQFQKSGSVSPIPEKKDNTDRTSQKRTQSVDKVRLELTITDLMSTDSAMYTCIASNAYGTDTKNLSLDVKFDPKFLPLGSAPTTYSHSGNLQPIECIVEANPLAVISWKRGQDDITDDGGVTYQIVNTEEKEKYRTISKLTVNVADDPARYGFYTCEAKSLDSPKITRTYPLEEAKAPGLPAKVTEIDVLPTQLKLVISAPDDDGGFPVLRYNIRYSLEDGEEKETSVPINRVEDRDEPKITTIAEITNLKPSKTYVFSVAAVNEVGRGDPSIVTVMTKDISKPGKVEITSGRNGLNSDKYRLIWKRPHSGGLELLSYKVKYRPVVVNFTTNAITHIKGDFIEMKINKEQTAVDLPSLLPNKTYQIVISAQNRLGSSTETTVVVTTAKGNVRSVLGGGPDPVRSSVVIILMSLAATTSCHALYAMP